MTRDEILKLASEAGFSVNDGIVMGGASDLERFAELITAARARQPLTPEEITVLSRIAADDPDDWPEPWAFHMGVVAAERHHGIRSEE